MKDEHNYRTIQKPQSPCYGCKERHEGCKRECQASKDYDEARFAYYGKVQAVKEKCEKIYAPSASAMAAYAAYEKKNRKNPHRFSK